MPDAVDQRSASDEAPRLQTSHPREGGDPAHHQAETRNGFPIGVGDDSEGDAEASAWPSRPIGSLLESIQSGYSFKGEDRPAEDGEAGVLKVSAVSYGRFLPEEHKALYEDRAKATVSPRKGHLIISRSNTFDLVGACVYVDADYLTLFLPDTLWLLTVREGISARWLNYVLASGPVRTDLQRVVTGTSGSMKKLSMKAFRKLKVPVPPLAEQRRIAAVLGTWDRALALLDDRLGALRERQRGLMQRLLTGAERFAAFEGQPWREVRLGDVTVEKRTRNKGKYGDTDLYGVLKSEGMVPMRDRVKGKSVAACKLVKPRAFAYNPMRLNVGSIARNETGREVMVSPDYIVFECRPEHLDADYFNYVRQSWAWKQCVESTGSGSVRVRIYYKHLRPMSLRLPSLEEQRRIAGVLAAGDREIAATEAQRAAVAEQKKGLMQQLLTGRCPVPA